ncbi:hypothetical protein [Bandra megavirus]|uniref:Uncharacterized protein n=1 Tax=Bandra megavirus TaxID=2071566 RepID=A0A2K9V704_9VIRU|nr:hypothetical protein [Bandra megavirus]
MNDQPNDTNSLNNLLNNLELEISKSEESGFTNNEAITNLMDYILENPNTDNNIINTTIQKSNNDQLKTTINDPKINEEETCDENDSDENDSDENDSDENNSDENDSDENDSDENDSDQVYTENQCLMGAYNHLCDIDKKMIKIIESRKNLFTPIPMRYKYIGVEYEYEHFSVRDILPKYSFSTLFDKFDALDSISYMIYSQQFDKSIEDID